MKPVARMTKLFGIKNPSNMLRDSDGDKVPNVFDCQPRNPKKPGRL